MNFKRVAIYVSRNARMPSSQMNTASVMLLYSKFLKGKAFDGFHSINIYVTSCKSENHLTIKQGGFVDFYILFDFIFFDTIKYSYAKKKYLIDSIQNGLIALCNQEQWPVARFEIAYEQCFINELKVECHFMDKHFLSPNKQYYFTLLHIVSFESFEIYEVLYNKNKKEIFRRICFFDRLPTFSVHWAAWALDSKSFSYKLSSSKKILTAEIADLLNRSTYHDSREKINIL